MPPELTGELHTLLTTVAYAAVTDQAFLRITGPDAPRWLNGMVTNNIQALQPGQGNYNFLLNAQGRIQGDCTLYREPQTTEASFLLRTGATQLETIHLLLDRFIIMDDVELTPAAEYTRGLHLLGPGASTLVHAVLHLEPPALRLVPLPHGILLTPATQAVPRFYFASSEVQTTLIEAGSDIGALQASPELLEQLRILEARPLFGTDIRDKDLPQETNQTQALHFAKGCYLGQEIVERIHSRGQVHRVFTPFLLHGAPPATLPARLEADGKPAGELTSVTTVTTTDGDRHLALGYARREPLDTSAPLTYPGGTAQKRTPGSLS